MNVPKNYSNVLVRKPWGYEYLFYQNDFVAIWCLHISEGESTSLHCHPNKKTGLILIAGEATLSFLNDTIDMKVLGRQLLRPGLFHSTKATKGEAILLEIETPPNKEDIVRFDDKYGRKGKPIETKTEPLPADCPLLTNGIHVGSCDLWIAKKGDWIDETAVIAILSGGMMAGKDMIVSPGDVGSFASYFKLGKSFKSENIKLLVVCAHRPLA